jgi:hypothetical protein
VKGQTVPDLVIHDAAEAIRFLESTGTVPPKCIRFLNSCKVRVEMEWQLTPAMENALRRMVRAAKHERSRAALLDQDYDENGDVQPGEGGFFDAYDSVM